LFANAVNIASEAAAARKQLREADKETVINVLDANNEVTNAQINFVTATYDELLSIYQMMLAMGRLNIAYLNLPLNQGLRRAISGYFAPSLLSNLFHIN
jgi:adhesin transport system outer membrane protein